MRPSGKIFNLILSFWAVAILWICIGTLINFHQHKIWGKPLLPELLYAKRDKEQSIVLAKLIKPDIPRDIKPWSVDYVNGVILAGSIEIKSSPSSLFLGTTDLIPEKRYIMSPGLRAPPVS